MPHIGNHVDAIFLPESVNTSTTLRINGGDLHLDDDKKLLLGNSDDFQIYYDGSIAHIDNDQGQIRMRAASSFLFYYEGNSGTEDYAKFLQNGAVELYHDGIKAFETTSTGIDVTGLTDTDTLNVSGTSTFQGNVHLLDDDRLQIGGSAGTVDGLEIYHDGSDSYINDTGTGALQVRTSALILRSNVGENMAFAYSNGTVQLYHNNSKKFETTASGIDVTGNDINLLGPTSGSTFTTSTLSLRGYRQSAAGQFGNIDFKNIDANSSNTEYLAARISAQIPDGADGGELKFFVTPHNSTTLTTPPAFTLHDDSSAEFASNLTVGGNLTVNGTTTTINSTTLTVDDLNIVLASGAADSSAADGAGITIDGANESLTWTNTNKSFKFSTRLAIGTATSQSANLRLSKDVGGENTTVYYSFLNNGLVQPDVTGTAYYNFVQVRTDGNSGTGYTISNLDAYSASVGSGTVHADTTITNMTAFEVKNTWIEGTNNYGFRGLIDAATNTNRWNVYMDGTAPNYFAGNVGIGTDNPTELLHLSADSAHEIFLERGGASPSEVRFANEGNLAVISNNTNGISFETGSTPSEAMRIKANGDVGIGTDNPGTKLHVEGSQNTLLHLESTDAFSGITMSDTGGSVVMQTASGYLRFLTGGDAGTLGTNSEERVRIKSDGNVGIGTDNPSEKLDVVGVAKASLLVDSIYASETWPAGNNTLAGNDLGTWTLTGGVLDTPGVATDDYHMVDTANLPDGLNAITWSSNGATSYLTSPNINITNLRTNRGIFGGTVGYSGNTDRTVADSRIYLTALLAAQSMDSTAEYMEVELSSDGGTTWVPDIAFVSQDSDQDTDDITDTYWRKVVIDISEYSSSTFQIRFKGTGTGTGDGYGVSNIYIHEAPIPNRLQAKTLKLGNGTITNSTYEHSHALTLVASTGTSKLIVLEDDDNPRQNYIGIHNSDNLEIAADEDNAGDESKIRFRIDGKERMRLYTDTDAGASVAHLQLIGHTTPTDRSNWRITAQDDGTHGYLTISDYSGGSWSTNLTVHESGNVGIGTTDPINLLQIYNGSGNTTTTIDAVGGDAKLNIRNSGNGNWSGINFIRERSSGTDVVGGGIFMPSETSNDSATLYIQAQSASGGSGITGDLTDDNGVRIKLVGGSGTNSHIAFETNNEALRIGSAGNVGIGTNNPVEKLDVRGHVKVDNGPVLEKASSVSGSGNTALRITSDTGWVEVGSQNTSYAHFYTDRDKFYFNKRVIVDEGIISAYNDNLKLATGNNGDNVAITALSSNSNVGVGIEAPVDRLHVAGGDAYFERRVGIGTTDHEGYGLSVRNINTPTTTGGIFIDCNDWSTNSSEYGINCDVDSTNRTNLTANRTHRGITTDVSIRIAQNASTTNTERQSAYGVYGRVIFNDTDNNDGKVYQAYGGSFTARVDGVNASNVRGVYSLAQCSDNATGQARTVDALYGAYNYAINDGNQTTITNAYATYAHVNQDDSGGTMSNAFGVYSRVDRDSGTGGTGYAFRGIFEGTWSTKRGLWLTGDTENQVAGSFSKGSGSFKIPHPLPEKNETHHLVHSFVESPQANNIYRGKVALVNGSATINLDTESTMTEGTFVLLNRDIHCFTSNESDWDAVRGSVSGNILTIECQNPSSTATVAWLVIGERHDQHMYDTGWTDENGKVIVEPLQPEPEVEEEKPEV